MTGADNSSEIIFDVRNSFQALKMQNKLITAKTISFGQIKLSASLRHRRKKLIKESNQAKHMVANQNKLSRERKCENVSENFVTGSFFVHSKL